MPSATLAPAAPSAATSTSLPSRNTAPAPATLQPRATDDEILGIISPRKNPARDTAQLEFDFDAAPSSTTSLSSRARADVWPDEGPAASSANDNQLQIPRSARNDNAQGASDTRSVATASSHDESSTQPHATQAQARMPVLPEPAHLRATFDANPELRSAWHDASAYRESFSTPEAAREATALLADVNHMDALFFSRRPEDHASLARAIANLDPAAFASLANAMQSIAANCRWFTYRRRLAGASSSTLLPGQQQQRDRAKPATARQRFRKRTTCHARTRCLATARAIHPFVIPSEGRCVARRGTCSSFSERQPLSRATHGKARLRAANRKQRATRRE